MQQLYMHIKNGKAEKIDSDLSTKGIKSTYLMMGMLFNRIRFLLPTGINSLISQGGQDNTEPFEVDYF
ncbi:hypothetical protein TorRG33x02_057180 [Trema orientale]|uniref:Uncharacterized protein n=1 Tax=Trema orientale TaxID=63057 RepID=A0A2P5FL35_TREOI|nr:hypothetical protein TorRG33x02_057180 [Trema orientale]